MITHIRTVGFKGFDLDEDVPIKAIYTGRNKSGKSTRAGAIAIALYGYIPFSTAGKRPGDILDSFGKDSLVASVTVGGKEFARKFSRNAKGVVSQSVQIDRKKASKENFVILLDKAGAPRIADVAEFMKQSETKKIDTLFDLFPNPELSTIDTEIEKAKEDVSRIEKKKDGADSTVVRLNASKVAIETPAGTIAAVREEIKSVETQISDLEKQIKDAEIEEAEIKAEEKGKQLEKERSDKEAEEKYFEEDQGGSPPLRSSELNTRFDSGVNENIDPLEAEIQKGENQIENYRAGESEPFHPDNVTHATVESSLASISIERIIDALKGAGCGTCAALIVAKQELKKFKGVS